MSGFYINGGSIIQRLVGQGEGSGLSYNPSILRGKAGYPRLIDTVWLGSATWLGARRCFIGSRGCWRRIFRGLDLCSGTEAMLHWGSPRQ